MRELPGAPDLPALFEVDRIRIEEEREDDALVVRAELPGMDPEQDIEVTVRDGVLQIQAHRERREETEEQGRFRSEFRYGTLVRRIPVAPGVTEEDVSATYRDGILEIRAPLPGADEPGPVRIPITRT